MCRSPSTLGSALLFPPPIAGRRPEKTGREPTNVANRVGPVDWRGLIYLAVLGGRRQRGFWVLLVVQAVFLILALCYLRRHGLL